MLSGFRPPNSSQLFDYKWILISVGPRPSREGGNPGARAGNQGAIWLGLGVGHRVCLRGRRKDRGFPLTTGGNDRRETGGTDRRETSGKMEGDRREGRGPAGRPEGDPREGWRGPGGNRKLPLPLRERVGVRGVSEGGRREGRRDPAGGMEGPGGSRELPLPLRERVGVRGRVMGTPREEEGGQTGVGPRNNSRS